MVMQEILFSLWENFLTNLYPLTLSIVWLIIGLIVGKVVGRIIREFLTRVKLDEYVIESDKIKLKLSDAFSTLFKWIIYFVFITIASETLGIQVVIEMVKAIIEFLIGVIKASTIILVGYTLASYIKEKVLHANTFYGDIIGKLVFFLIIYISISTALPLVGIERLTQLTDTILLIIVGALGLGLAIALGLGLKPFVEEVSKKYGKKFK